MPKNLKPKIIWLLIGTNDFKRQNFCSAEVVVMGIKAVVQKIRALRPSAVVVVNAIFPRGDLDGMRGKLMTRDPDTAWVQPTPIWKAIQTINDQLEEYCKSMPNTLYANYNHLFIERNTETGEDHIPRELMDDALHPTAKGYRIWGEQIVKKVKHLARNVN
eukprot:CAMPEP_0118685848 /NCGR_PEP_ID=MMETSP0800-20121206/7480_1 /TAXON_ID=210618 ORGANISM="Striatella unipunctata, Strain CCMP2910" /NCGR_SAMPLE_ID=MMETSP0800 /ASSEMBLY_ACC=CAM_ASM_000638 /LENGTH=160 /DNA_ID=CAMNT_0006582817 /DNA_START=146 /DNA_END=628 /DNA_ORIENTATION=-